MVERLAAQLPGGRGAVVLNANGDPRRVSTSYGLPVAADSVDGLRRAARRRPGGARRTPPRVGAARIVTVAADTPFFPTDLVAGMEAAAAQGEGAPLACAATPDAEGAAPGSSNLRSLA